MTVEAFHRRPRRHERPRPLSRDGRAELRAERATLVARVDALIHEQDRSARLVAELRGRLRELRDILWPAGPNHAFRSFRRPRIGGPSPIAPMPPAGATPLRGARLRYTALAVLARAGAGTALSLPDIHAALHRAGYTITAPNPVKALADALGYDHDTGRARRVTRGVYTVGTLSPRQRRRLLDRLDDDARTATRAPGP